MSRFWPHTSHAEEQPLAKTILYVHVLFRGYQAGTVIGGISSLVRPLLFNKSQPRNLLRAVGIGGAAGTVAMTVIMPFYMWNQTDIQWKDRSWRLQENKGQVETDDWCYSGSLAGAVYAAVKKPAVPIAGLNATVGQSALRILGGAGMGNMVGLVGYMAWRYGMHGGKFD